MQSGLLRMRVTEVYGAPGAHETARVTYDGLVLEVDQLQHAKHANVSGRYDRQAVAPTTLEAGFDRIVVVAEFDLARADSGIAEFDLISIPAMRPL